MVKSLQSIAKALSLPKGSGLTARSSEPELEPDAEPELEESDAEEDEVEDPTPVSGSQFNKKSATAEPHEEELEDEDVEQTLEKRIVNSGQVPGAGIPQDLPSGIVMWLIILMVYAMFCTISMKEE